MDGLLVSQPESRYYLSGYTGRDLPPRDSAGYLLVTSRHALLLTDPRTSEQAEREAGGELEVVAYASRALGPAKVGEMARKLGVRRLGFEAVHLPYAIWQSIRDSAGHSSVLEMVDAADAIDRLRAIKDVVEIQQLQDAVDVLDLCFAHLVSWLQPGVSEREVAREVERFLVERADGPSFEPIVASGPNGSMPHAAPTARPLQPGEGVTIDIGARVSFYCSDMTRTISLGEPQDARLREVHAVVAEAKAAAQAQIRPGMTGREADRVARAVVERAGYGDAFTHGLGHGIGLEVHEPPWVSWSQGDEPLEAGMVFSLEPGIYLPGWGGVRIEDLVVLETDGPRVLCHASTTLVVDGSTTNGGF